MKQRILVAVFGIPVILGIVVFAPDWATAVAVAGLCVIAAHELLNAVSGAEKAKRWFGLAGAMAVFTVFAVYCGGARFAGTILPALAAFFQAAMVVLVFVCAVVEYGGEHQLTFTDICAILLAGLAIPMALGALLQLRMLPYGGGMVLIPMVAAFCSDSAALFAGMAFGKHKLAPKVSPKKTVEGAIGGLLGGMLGMVIFRVIFYLCTVQPLHIGWCVLLGLVGAVMGQLGDLSFSVIKRQQGIKDYGRLLPGHGGVLDRFDSVIFAAPVVWLIVSHVTL
ncbi:MAG: phosphatidate cytidylyltransferase [Ruminococcaceae bacterium]|nr:phosphatidate cytidylyltransferase [Oscillospiraceae bacterium]